MRGSLRKRGDVWGALFYVNGKRYWKRFGIMSKRDAQKELRQLLTEVDRGTYKTTKSPKFSEFAENWFNTYAVANVRESTQIRYRELIDIHLAPFFGDIILKNITAEKAQQYLSQRVKEGKFSAATINRSRTLLYQIMNHAVQWKYIYENPVQFVKALKIIKKEMNFLNKDEIIKLLQNVPKKYYVFFLMTVYTGMRKGELLGAKWKNLDWNNNTYFVRESFSRGKFVEPKSRTSKRNIVLSPIVIEELKSHKAQQNIQRLQEGDKWHNLDIIFATPLGKPIDPGNLEKRIFKPTLKRAGIKNIRFHDLRHTNVSLRIEAGEHPKRIQQQLGHSSIQVTLDTYGHLMEENNQESALKMQQLLAVN